MFLIALALFQFQNPAQAQDLTPDLPLHEIHIDSHDMHFHVGKLKKTKCAKRSPSPYYDNQDQIEYTVYMVNGKAQCSEPYVEKYCVIQHTIKMREYETMDYSDTNLCRLAYAKRDGDAYSLEFEKLFCPSVTCYTSWLDTVTFSDFTVSNFEYNVGQFLTFDKKN
jgi:hypothetical protein